MRLLASSEQHFPFPAERGEMHVSDSYVNVAIDAVLANMYRPHIPHDSAAAETATSSWMQHPGNTYFILSYMFLTLKAVKIELKVIRKGRLYQHTNSSSTNLYLAREMMHGPSASSK